MFTAIRSFSFNQPIEGNRTADAACFKHYTLEPLNPQRQHITENWATSSCMCCPPFLQQYLIVLLGLSWSVSAKSSRFLWLGAQSQAGWVPAFWPDHFISLHQAKESALMKLHLWPLEKLKSAIADRCLVSKSDIPPVLRFNQLGGPLRNGLSRRSKLSWRSEPLQQLRNLAAVQDAPALSITGRANLFTSV